MNQITNKETINLSITDILSIAERNPNGTAMFFASTFWTKLQNIFGHCCMSKLDKVAKRWPVMIRPAI